MFKLIINKKKMKFSTFIEVDKYICQKNDIKIIKVPFQYWIDFTCAPEIGLGGIARELPYLDYCKFNDIDYELSEYRGIPIIMLPPLKK